MLFTPFQLPVSNSPSRNDIEISDVGPSSHWLDHKYMCRQSPSHHVSSYGFGIIVLKSLSFMGPTNIGSWASFSLFLPSLVAV